MNKTNKRIGIILAAILLAAGYSGFAALSPVDLALQALGRRASVVPEQVAGLEGGEAAAPGGGGGAGSGGGAGDGAGSRAGGGVEAGAAVHPRLAMAEVELVRMVGELTVSPLRSIWPGDRLKIARIVAWLNAAEVVAGPPSAGIGRRTELEIQTRDGRRVRVSPAIACSMSEQAGKTVIRCNRVNGEVVFTPGDGQPPVRLRAPDLADWLDGGWEADFPRRPG